MYMVVHLVEEHSLLRSNLKVLSRYKLLILRHNSYFNANKRLSLTRWTTLYCHIDLGNNHVNASDVMHHVAFQHSSGTSTEPDGR